VPDRAYGDNQSLIGSRMWAFNCNKSLSLKDLERQFTALTSVL